MEEQTKTEYTPELSEVSATTFDGSLTPGEPLIINRDEIATEPIRDELGRLKKGVILNPNGRPKGSISPITKIKQIFEENPETFQDFVREYMLDPANRKHVVEMIDGKPRQNIGLDGGEQGLAIQFANVFNKNE